MKKQTIAQFVAAFAAIALTYGAPALADQVVTTTTTADGSITEFSPDTIVVHSETSPEPLRYGYTKTTTYVDDAGAPVSREIIKEGVPVTVHYVHHGDRLIADRVIVHKKKIVEPATGTTIEKRTTITK